MRRYLPYIILYCAVYARATCNASTVSPDEGIPRISDSRTGTSNKWRLFSRVFYHGGDSHI